MAPKTVIFGNVDDNNKNHVALFCGQAVSRISCAGL